LVKLRAGSELVRGAPPEWPEVAEAIVRCAARRSMLGLRAIT
jgi:hypothetical protein